MSMNFGGECYANIIFPGFTISAKVLSILRLQPGALRVADGKQKQLLVRKRFVISFFIRIFVVR